MTEKKCPGSLFYETKSGRKTNTLKVAFYNNTLSMRPPQTVERANEAQKHLCELARSRRLQLYVYGGADERLRVRQVIYQCVAEWFRVVARSPELLFDAIDLKEFDRLAVLAVRYSARPPEEVLSFPGRALLQAAPRSLRDASAVRLWPSNVAEQLLKRYRRAPEASAESVSQACGVCAADVLDLEEEARRWLSAVLLRPVSRECPRVVVSWRAAVFVAYHSPAKGSEDPAEALEAQLAAVARGPLRSALLRSLAAEAPEEAPRWERGVLKQYVAHRCRLAGADAAAAEWLRSVLRLPLLCVRHAAAPGELAAVQCELEAFAARGASDLVRFPAAELLRAAPSLFQRLERVSGAAVVCPPSLAHAFEEAYARLQGAAPEDVAAEVGVSVLGVAVLERRAFLWLGSALLGPVAGPTREVATWGALEYLRFHRAGTREALVGLSEALNGASSDLKAAFERGLMSGAYPHLQRGVQIDTPLPTIAPLKDIDTPELFY